MTLDEFIDALAETRDKLDWKVNPVNGLIRTRVPIGKTSTVEACPVEAVAYVRRGRQTYLCSAQGFLGMSDADAALVIDASDRRPNGSGPVRKRILNALGLTVESCL